MVSNHATDWFNEYAAKGDVYSVFTVNELVVVSQEVRCAKPDFSIFQTVMARVAAVRPNTRPEQVLFFDDKQANIDAARQFGWRAELFNNRRQNGQVMLELLNKYGVFV